MKDSAQPGALSAPVHHHHHGHGHIHEQPKPSALSVFFPIWARYLTGAFVIGFVVYSLFYVLKQRSIESASEIWYNLDIKTSSEALKEFASSSDSGLAGKIAQFKIAREDLRNGLRDFASRKLAEVKTKEGTPALPKGDVPLASQEALNRAATSYGELAKASGLPKILEVEANLGAGKALEALGAFSEAKTYYEKAAALAPDSEMSKQAKAGVDRLSKSAAEIKALQDELLKSAKGQRS